MTNQRWTWTKKDEKQAVHDLLTVRKHERQNVVRLEHLAQWCADAGYAQPMSAAESFVRDAASGAESVPGARSLALEIGSHAVTEMRRMQDATAQLRDALQILNVIPEA